MSPQYALLADRSVDAILILSFGLPPAGPPARALNDALPLIERAERVTVLAVNAADLVDRYGALPPERMVEHLRRHSASVEGLELKDIPTHSIGDILQAEADRLGADLLVAGAFVHVGLFRAPSNITGN
jgi:hypothetical protein